jgi:hypothetical protein
MPPNIGFTSDQWSGLMTVGNLVELILFQWAFVESIPTEGCSNCHLALFMQRAIALESLGFIEFPAWISHFWDECNSDLLTAFVVGGTPVWLRIACSPGTMTRSRDSARTPSYLSARGSHTASRWQSSHKVGEPRTLFVSFQVASR